MIKTPDQRLRIFVSSTVNELAAEREAATDAIRELRLSPVLSELGARSHAPQEVYRAYLAQSDIFIGIYWQSYGPVAQGMEVSGIEDELTLAGDMPKLIYIKRPAPDREPRLEAMLERFRSGETISYRPFENAEELKELIKDDLVVMLTERFEQQGLSSTGGTTTPAPSVNLPSFVNEFVGRERELADVVDMIQRPDVRLITLTGPGGIGKSRLALEAGAAVRDRFPDGVHLVELESVTDPSLVLPTIASTLQVADSLNMFGDSLMQFLKEKRMLLILDNLEQVLPSATELVRLLEGSAGLKLLITSRMVLNVRGEHEVPVPVLGVPEEGPARPETLVGCSAVKLFVARVRASDPSFELTAHNASAVAEITRRLDGLPLALELAAARARMFPPEVLLGRLDDRFQILTGGAADLPQRHRALRTTIAWSFDLLAEGERELFIRLAAFKGGWSLEAAEAVCGDATTDLLTDIQALLESSLVRLTAEEDEPRFAMLETVREFAAELLRQAEYGEGTQEAHALYFLDLVQKSGLGLRTGSQASWLRRLEADHDNLRAAFAWALENGRAEQVAEAGWALWIFWWIRSHLDEGLRWMMAASEADNLSRSARARASAVAGVMHFWRANFGEALPLIAPVLEEFRELGDKTGIALCQLALGFMEASVSEPSTAFARFDEAREIFEEQNDLWGQTLSLNAICWLALSLDIEDFDEDRFRQAVGFAQRIGVDADLAMAVGNLGRRHLFRGEFASAEDLMYQALKIFADNCILSSASYILDGFAEMSTLRGQHERAALLFGAAERLRRDSQFPLLPFLLGRWERWTDRLKQEMGETAFEERFEAGLKMTLDEAAAYLDPELVKS